MRSYLGLFLRARHRLARQYHRIKVASCEGGGPRCGPFSHGPFFEGLLCDEMTMADTGSTTKTLLARQWRLPDLLRPHWKEMSLARVAVAGETAAELLEPWPLKIALDYVLQSKEMPGWLAAVVQRAAGDNPLAVLHFAVASVIGIAIVGAVSTFAEKYLTTSVGQWVGHDMRRTLYHHIHRLSLSQHDEARTGDLIGRVTTDIEAIQDFITTALLGMVVNVLTLAGMIAEIGR